MGESLDLSNNHLETYSLRSENNFRRLSTLNLAHNYLTDIARNWQLQYPILRLLNVSYNLLGPTITGYELQFVKRYMGLVVDLSHNKIEQILMLENDAPYIHEDIK